MGIFLTFTIRGRPNAYDYTTRKETLINFLYSQADKENPIIIKAITHGDFNQGQLLKKDNRIIIIDWSEGGFQNICFDIITCTLNVHNEFELDLIPEELKLLKESLIETISAQKDIYIALTLLEVLRTQYHMYKQMRGPYQRWQLQVDNQIAKISYKD